MANYEPLARNAVALNLALYSEEALDMNVIAISGMHRSGTSFFAELVHALGAVVGSDLLEGADDNPHGFFEHRGVKELNDVILRRLGGTWDRPPVGLSGRWAESGGLDSLRRSAEIIIADLSAEAVDSGACVIKDPRLSITLPFWTSATRIDHVVVPLRDPREVAQSLRHRDGISSERSAALWLRYTVDAVLGVPHPIIVSLADVIDDATGAVAAIARSLGLEGDLEPALALAADRRRHWVPPEAQAALPDGPTLRLAASVHDALATVGRVEPLAPVLERVAAAWRLDESSASWSATTGLRTSAAEAVAERYRSLRVELEDVRLRAADLEEERNTARRELRNTERRLEQETGRWQREIDGLRSELTGAKERLNSEVNRLERLVADEQEARQVAESQRAAAEEAGSIAEEAGSIAERAREDAVRRADGFEQRFRRVERDYLRLRSRRSVRLATAAASTFRPVFRTVRRARRIGRGGAVRRSTHRKAAPTKGGVQKTLQTFPAELDRTTRSSLRAYRMTKPGLADTKVSIVMPSYNRAEQIGEAVKSVLAQTHTAWELLIIDDGSSDDTASVVERFARGDDRVRYVANPRGGVSRARNTGLDLATGEFVAFLDTDNTWDPEFLELLTAALDQSGAVVGYSAMESVRDGAVVSYRGDRFDYEAMRSGNYVDLNVICHRRTVTDAGVRFDTSLRRTVDWDYLLEICRDVDVTYAPFIGGRYKLHESDDQISNREPYLYRKIVAARHDPATAAHDALSAYRSLRLDIAIALAAPQSRREEWGDFHFATGLAEALERRGHSATLYYYDDRVRDHHDVTVSLRGLTGHDAPRRSVRVVWSISHPELLTWDEIEDCDLFFSASVSWPQMLNWVVEGSHYSLLQATDRKRFYPHPEIVPSEDILFVGNSRNADRPMVTKAVESGLPLAVYGTRWEGRIPGRVVRGAHIPNEKLSKSYAGAGTVLNDHWESMREFGFVSNRVFDVIASGGALVSDPVPALTKVFGDLVAVAGDEDDLREVVSTRVHRPSAADARWVLDHHSFDSRAASLLSRVEDFLLRNDGGKTGTDRIDGGGASAGVARLPQLDLGPLALRGAMETLRVAIAPQMTRIGPTSSAFIRLVQPLTSEIDGVALDLVRLEPEADERSMSAQLDGIDVLAISRTALADPAAASELMAAADARSIPVVLDLDDAFHRMDSGHPEYQLYRKRIEALEIVIQSADEIWCSTEPLAESLADRSSDVIVVPNSLDPRLWRVFRENDQSGGTKRTEALEILYAGSATHGSDFESLVPALDRLARKVNFRLTLVGVAPKIPKRRWIRRMSPTHGSYPRYATWIRDHAASFDVGVAPLVDSEFNRLKSDVKLLEYLALGLVPVASAVGPYLSSEALAVGGLCSTVDDWVERLATLAEDGALADARKLAHAERDQIWVSRSAAATGARLASRLVELAD